MSDQRVEFVRAGTFGCFKGLGWTAMSAVCNILGGHNWSETTSFMGKAGSVAAIGIGVLASAAAGREFLIAGSLLQEANARQDSLNSNPTEG